MQAAKEAGRALQLMKLCNNLGAVQRKKLGKTAEAYTVYQVLWTAECMCWLYACVAMPQKRCAG